MKENKGSTLLSWYLRWAIHRVKWIERQAWHVTPVNKILKSHGKRLAESLGIVLHCPGDPEWTDKDTTRVLAACVPGYETLIHLRIHDDREYFTRLANGGALGAGEAYMDEIWDGVYGGGEDISEMIKRVCEHDIFDLYWNMWNRGLEWVQLKLNTRSVQVAMQQHYGLDLYELMLDPWMQYSCGYWAHADNLNDAQIHKMELIAKKLDLKPGMVILDICCGWGTLCKYLAENYQVKCVGLSNLSDEGISYARKICRGLSVEIRTQDFQHLANEKFDRIVSVGLFEQVGVENYRTFFQVVQRSLKKDGIFLLHTIGRNHVNLPSSEPWLRTYIFPNAINFPSPEDITRGTAGLFVIEDWHNFGLDYAKTLDAWRRNFIQRWPTIRNKYGDRFYRIWLYYLSASRGIFLAKRAQLWQIVLSRDGLKKDYRDVR